MRVKIDISQGVDIFFISDFHLYHKSVIKFDNRPFRDEFGQPDVEAMHTRIRENWNNTVGKNDVVFYLGDLCFSNPKKGTEFMDTLNGKIHFVMGNHDKYQDIIKSPRYEGVYDLVDLIIYNGKPDERNDPHFVLCHYPIYSTNRIGYGSYHVHGHTHGNLHHGEPTHFNYYENRRAIDAGCNVIDYTPLSYKKVIQTFN